MTDPRPMWSLEDLSYLPDDWLEAFLVLIDEDSDRDPDTHFIDSIEVIFRMRDISRREGRQFAAFPRNAQAEKLRREGKPIPVERGQVYDWKGTVFEVARISVAHGWADIRCTGAGGNSWSKRQRLPLPADSRLIGWAR